MRFTAYLRFLGVALAFLILPMLAAAQDSVKCESNDGNRQYCGNYSPDQVRFDRQISESSCTEGQTWGVDRDGLWVDRGCRAIFLIGGDNRRGGEQYGGGPAQSSVTCSSDDGNRQYCGNFNHDQVTAGAANQRVQLLRRRNMGRRPRWTLGGPRLPRHFHNFHESGRA